MAGLALRDLEALTLIAQHRNFRRAAAALHVSPSALSHMVAALEARLGVRLVNRSTRSVSLTEAGQAFVDRVTPALGAITEAIETVDHYRDTPSGRIRITASEGGAERALPKLLAFMAAYPEIEVELSTTGRLVDIVAEGFDAGLRLAEAAPQDMIALPVAEDEAFIVVGSPAYLTERSSPRQPEHLSDHECIRSLLPNGRLLPWEFTRDGEPVSIPVRGRLVVGSSNIARRAARAGAGLAYVDVWSASEELAQGHLMQLLADWTPPFPGGRLVYPRQRLPSAAFRALIDFVRETSQTSAQEHASDADG